MCSLLHVGRSMSAGRAWRQVAPMLLWGGQCHNVQPSTHAALLKQFSTATPIYSTHYQPTTSEIQVRWLHPGDDRVNAMVARNNNGSFLQGVFMTLHSDHPLEPQLIREASTYLYNKVPLMRTCLRERDGDWWFCQMPTPSIDFQVVAGADPLKETLSLLNIPLNLSNGPLWRVRLLSSTPEVPYLSPEMKEKFPYRATLLFDFHHGAFDGVDLTLITGWLLKLIDDIISEKAIDDKQYGQHADYSQISEICQKIKSDLENVPQRLSSLLKLKNEEVTPLIIEAFGAPEPSQANTDFLEKVFLNTSDVTKFHDKCRSEDISFNAGFGSVINTAIVEAVKDAGLIRDVYNIRGRIPIDVRRYMKGDSKNFPMGFHNAPMFRNTSYPYNVKDHFWMYAKKYNVEFQTNLKNKLFFEDMVINRMLRPADFSNDKFYVNPEPLSNDYMFVNMYTPNFRTFGQGKHVQITDLKNIVPIHKSDILFMCILMNLRDNVRFDLWYSTRGMTKETAEKILHKILTVFSEICKHI